MTYASLTDLPLEICDEIVDICSALGGDSLLWKCMRVHIGFMPRIYGHFFRHVSFSSTILFADQYRESRISSFIDIVRKRPLIAQLIKSFTLQLHEHNDWLIDNEASRFPELIRLLRSLDAQPSQLCISKLPGIDIVHLTSQDKLRDEVISPFFSHIKSLTIMGIDVSHSTLAAFTCLEEVVLHRAAVSWVSIDDMRRPTRCIEREPKILSLRVRRCPKGEGVASLFNQWCGLPFQFSELKELQCPIERPSEAILLVHLQKSINSTTFGSKLHQIHLQIDSNSPYNRSTVDNLNFSDSPRLRFLRITLRTRHFERYEPLPDCQTYVHSMASLMRSSRLPPSLQRFTIDFIFFSQLQCDGALRCIRWDGLLQRARHSEGRRPTHNSNIIDSRINFIICGHVYRPQLHRKGTVSDMERPRFDGWYFFDYEHFEGEGKPLRLQKNFIRFSAHSTWAQPASQDDIRFILYEF